MCFQLSGCASVEIRAAGENQARSQNKSKFCFHAGIAGVLTLVASNFLNDCPGNAIKIFYDSARRVHFTFLCGGFWFLILIVILPRLPACPPKLWGVLPKSISASDVGQTFLSAGSGDFPVPGFRVKPSALVREVGKLRNRQARKPALQI
jgi:hypothetical protein